MTNKGAKKEKMERGEFYLLSATVPHFPWFGRIVLAIVINLQVVRGLIGDDFEHPSFAFVLLSRHFIPI